MTKAELTSFNLLLNTFNSISQNGINGAYEKWLLENLPKSLPLFTHLIAFYNFPKLERVTINRNIMKTNKRIRKINFLENPPKDYVNKYGRCNLKKDSIFYASPMLTTALSEMRPKVGDLITKSIWKLKEEHTFKICPIFHIQPNNGTMNVNTFELEKKFYELVNKNFEENDRLAVINLTKFIAYHFSKPVNPENDKDYLFSAYFAHKLLNELDNGTIEGILYPSVKEHLSFENVALKADVFEKYYYLFEVHESIIIKDPSDGDGGILMRGTSLCSKFDYENKEILWDKETMLTNKELEYFQNQFGIDLT